MIVYTSTMLEDLISDDVPLISIYSQMLSESRLCYLTLNLLNIVLL